jgi:hypothetical protein
MQGQACERIILDLKSRPFSPQIYYHGLYVALSKVKQSQHLRCSRENALNLILCNLATEPPFFP